MDWLPVSVVHMRRVQGKREEARSRECVGDRWGHRGGGTRRGRTGHPWPLPLNGQDAVTSPGPRGRRRERDGG
jgi:hypothetical protein